MLYQIENFKTTGNLALKRRIEDLEIARKSNAAILINNKKKKKRKNIQRVQPFRELSDIQLMKTHFLSRKHYRDYTLFIMGINFGIRCGDLLKLKWSNILTSTGEIVSTYTFIEQKTNKDRTINFKPPVKEALNLLMSHTKDRTGYIFKSQRAAKLTVTGTGILLKKAAKACNITYNINTHSMRKTYGYHQLMLHKDDAEFVAELMDLFGHSNMKDTLKYCGLSDDRKRAYDLDLEL